MTNTLLYALGGYVILTWIGTCIAIAWGEDAEWSLSVAQLPGWAKLGACVVVLLIGPIMFPVWLVQGLVEQHIESRKIEKLKRTHREYVFEKLHPAKLPYGAREHFEEGTQPLLDLGFTPLGNFLMKPEPVGLYGRCFLSSDGTTFTTLCYILDTPACAMITIFQGERVLETTTVGPFAEIETLRQRGKVFAQCLTGASFAETYQGHVEKTCQLEADLDTAALAFDAGQLIDVYRWYGRLFSRELYEIGKRDASPPDTVLPTGHPRPTPLPTLITDQSTFSPEAAPEPF